MLSEAKLGQKDRREVAQNAEKAKLAQNKSTISLNFSTAIVGTKRWHI